MRISILPLVAVLVGGIFILKAGAQTCDLREAEQKQGGGLCQSRGKPDPAKCQEHCAKKYEGELASSACVERNDGDCKPVCVCKLKCATADCWGDPHCTSFDGIKFDYQGVKKFYLLKPCRKYTSLPNFELRGFTYPYVGGPMQVLDTIELIIPEWERAVEVALPKPGRDLFGLTVNNKPREIEYQYPSADDDSCTLDFVKVYYKDKNTKTHVVIETSFGLRVTMAALGFLTVEIPKHPELKHKLCGLLGRPDGNQTNDFLDCNGVQQTPQPGIGLFNWAFGDSCIVPGNGAWDMKCFRDDAEKKHEEHKKNIDPEVEKKIRELCKANLENPEFIECAKKAGRTPIGVEHCVFDVLFMKTDSERKAYIKNLMKGGCGEKQIEFKDTDTSCANNLVPLYRIYSPEYVTHCYTGSVYHTAYHTTQNPIRFYMEGSPGQVASTAETCGSGAPYTRVNVMYGPPGGDRKTGKHLHVRDNELPPFEKEGYVKHPEVEFFCAATAGQCGATVPLRRYIMNAGGKSHVLTTNLKETPGTFVDVLCYIWPHPPQAKEWTKMNLHGIKDGDFY